MNGILPVPFGIIFLIIPKQSPNQQPKNVDNRRETHKIWNSGFLIRLFKYLEWVSVKWCLRIYGSKLSKKMPLRVDYSRASRNRSDRRFQPIPGRGMGSFQRYQPLFLSLSKLFNLKIWILIWEIVKSLTFKELKIFICYRI